MHHIALNTANLDRLYRFYVEVLGFTPTIEEFRWHNDPQIDRLVGLEHSAGRTRMLELGNCYFELFEYCAPAARAAPLLRPCNHGYTHFSLNVTDIQAEHQRLLQAGMEFCDERLGGSGELIALYGKDPYRNIIEIQQNSPEHGFFHGAARRRQVLADWLVVRMLRRWNNAPWSGRMLIDASDTMIKMTRGVGAVRWLVAGAWWGAALAAAPVLNSSLDMAMKPDNWESFGRTAGEDHYSPLTQIDATTIKGLKLAWYMDLPPGNTVSAPVEVDGTLYVASGYSIVRAIDSVSGKLLWTYDPKAPEASGRKLRQGWGIRGLAYSEGRLFVATHDGRLQALDPKTGRLIWSVLTVDPNDVRFVSGAPRAFHNRVLIGHGGADVGSIRGYVDCYDGRSGKRLWRFYTVPGNPSAGFENNAMAMAAKTWSGAWWDKGGGGTVWNSMTYDPEFNVFYLGVGNGAPWNRKVRSEGKGDNLFLASVVAVDADTGSYKWHYQENPGESWDYNASMDMELATLNVDGEPRKVLMTAPKNGFFYVIDRTNGKLISAQPFAKVNWASKIDIASGRPVEMPNIRYENGETTMWPGPVGAHSWTPMSFNEKTGLVYIPTIELPAGYNDTTIDPKTWKRTPGNAIDGAVVPSFTPNLPGAGVSYLQAWDPVQQRSVWRVPNPSFWNGGTMTTAGNLVFQGQIDRQFNAYTADTGRLVWSFDAGAAVIAPPITYRVGGRQYVTVLSGNDTSGSAFGLLYQQYKIDYRTQKRRVLTFALDGAAALPPSEPKVAFAPALDPDYHADVAAAERGALKYAQYCAVCHGVAVIAGGHAPELRSSSIPLAQASFKAVVHDGVLVHNAMPRFEEFDDDQLNDIRQYIRSEAHVAAAN